MKMQKMKEEREEERAKFEQEIEAIRQQNMHTPTSDYQEDTDNDPRQSRTYELMQSIARLPIKTSPDIAERVVVGKEVECLRSPHHSTSPDIPNSYQSFSALSESPNSSPETMVRRTSITQEQINEDTVDINIVDKEEGLFRMDSQSENKNGYCIVTSVNGEKDLFDAE